MTAPDVRTAAQAEAEQRWRRDAGKPWHRVFVSGAVWGAALSTEGIVISDFQGDGVYRDQKGRIWQPLDDTRAAVETAIAETEARVTPTREQIADTVAQFFGMDDTPYDVADAVLALIQKQSTES